MVVREVKQTRARARGASDGGQRESRRRLEDPRGAVGSEGKIRVETNVEE